MISADLERLGLPHEKPNLAGSLMLQELHSAGATLLPLVPVLVEPVKLRFAAISEKTSINRTNQWQNSKIGKQKRRKKRERKSVTDPGLHLRPPRRW